MRSYLLLPFLILSIGSFGGCDDEAPAGPQYFERVIQPILTANCVRNQASCHKDDGSGNAVGNLDVTSYAAITRRRDVLRSFGAYPLPLLLIKAAGTAVPAIPYKSGGVAAAPMPSPAADTITLIPSEILHVGGSTISIDSGAFLELQRWMDSGANEDGSVTVRPRQSGVGSCNKNFAQVRPDVAAQLGTVDTSSQAFQDFAKNVEPVVAGSCAFGTCHSAEQSDFFLTCQGSGSDDATKFNFLEVQQYISTPADTSLVLLKPLAPSAGGLSHTGGVFFANKDDTNWKNLLAWATEVGAAAAGATLTQGQQFFTANVMPVFLKRGCALEACHSPGSPNDFKLRAGTPGGFFSRFSLDFNYREARQNFLVADIPDVRQTRIVKKPVLSYFERGFGLPHRGGPPLQSTGDPPGLDPTLCPSPWPGSDVSTPFCTFVEWHRIERQALLASGQADPLATGDRLPIVYVQRTPDGDRLIDFDTFRGGSDLMLGTLTLGNLAVVDPASAQAGASLLGNCAGVQPPDGQGLRPNVDVRGPDVSYDASKIAFAMRLGAADTLDVYEVTLDAAHTCTKITDGNGQSQNGILKHNLDPMYAPDGSLVFASTRGKAGPTRSLKYLLPQTDLWRVQRNGGGYGAPEQMTSLLGSELGPEMMLNGQISFTAEKASADFYQLSGRRINWDLTDYHPLLAQRAKSPALGDADLAPGHGMHASIDYQQATEIREGIDRNFVLILSDVGAKGAGGTLALFNRSVGPFSAELKAAVTYLPALTIPDAAATGRAGATQGAYRSPVQLPDGRYLVSYAPDVTDLAAAATVRYDLALVDVRAASTATVPLRVALPAMSGGALSRVEAMPVYKREPRQGFRNLTQLVFGGHADAADLAHGSVHYPDLPMLGTLLGANLRSGRFVDALRAATQVAIYQDQAPPSDLASAMAGQTGSQMVFQNRTKLGTAPLESDGSVQLTLPSLTPLILELRDAQDNIVFTMAEEDQLGPGEHISRGVPQAFFNSVCGGCHGAVSGRELDIAPNPDALTQASASLSRDPSKAVSIGP